MEKKIIAPYKKIGPLFDSIRFKDTKDPCIVFDGTLWHLFGSGGTTETEVWQILHATSENLEGPWQEKNPVILSGLSGDHVAAPSVEYDAENKIFHMVVQRDFMVLGGGLEYLISTDGEVFTWQDTILHALDDSLEAGLYDPHFAFSQGKKYIVYAGIPATVGLNKPFIPQPDVFLLECERDEWIGPWKRCKKILDHDDIAWHHNRREHPDYEWGIEGPQLVDLHNGKFLLNATCFVEEGRRGTRQRVFFAISESVRGPFKSIGPVLNHFKESWESGENGHASAVVLGEDLVLFYQARSGEKIVPQENNWKYGVAFFKIKEILENS